MTPSIRTRKSRGKKRLGLRTDVLLVYRIMFGIVRPNSNEFFTLRNQPHLRGHNMIVINKQRCCEFVAIEEITS